MKIQKFIKENCNKILLLTLFVLIVFIAVVKIMGNKKENFYQYPYSYTDKIRTNCIKDDDKNFYRYIPDEDVFVQYSIGY